MGSQMEKVSTLGKMGLSMLVSSSKASSMAREDGRVPRDLSQVTNMTEIILTTKSMDTACSRGRAAINTKVSTKTTSETAMER